MSLIGFSRGREERERGNRLFTEKKYEEALGCYSAAIAKDQKEPTLYTNRALCQLKLEQWDKASNDCQTAIQLNSSSIKAHFYFGQAQLELENFDVAIDALQTAHTLAREQRRNFGDDIAYCLRMAKKKRWQCLEEQRLRKESSLQLLLNQLLVEYKDKEISVLEASGITSDELKERTEKLQREHNEHVTELNQVFIEADDKKKKRDVPDYLCGKISFELIRDPCITPSGITYERKDIEEHLNRVGHFDPVTRKKLTVDQLIPNLAIKEVVDTFVAENGWVEEY